MNSNRVANKRKVALSRVIEEIRTSPYKPSALFIAGMHGNEGVGVKAFEEVLKEIKQSEIKVDGNIFGIRGNLKALETNERFIDKDLNRLWTKENIDKALRKSSELAEFEELKEIHDYCIDVIEWSKVDRNACFVDLHTTSGESSPFIIIDDTVRNIRLARGVPATIVLGVIEKLEGTFVSYFGEYGVKTLVFEAGQHFADNSLERHKAAIWLILHRMQIIKLDDARFKSLFSYLRKASSGNPKVVETIERFAIDDGRNYQMRPGFVNFMPITKDQELGDYHNKTVKASAHGLVFMPLYQDQGEDGYFITKPIASNWLSVAITLREMGAHKVFHWLPGVKKHPTEAETFIINTNVASYKTQQILHLFGFRKEKQVGHTIVAKRLSYDIKGPLG